MLPLLVDAGHPSPYKNFLTINQASVLIVPKPFYLVFELKSYSSPRFLCVLRFSAVKKTLTAENKSEKRIRREEALNFEFTLSPVGFLQRL